MSNYEMRMIWDNTDKIFVVEVPELPGCIAHGETRIEAIKNAEEAITAFIEVAQEEGISLPPPNTREHTA